MRRQRHERNKQTLPPLVSPLLLSIHSLLFIQLKMVYEILCGQLKCRNCMTRQVVKTLFSLEKFVTEFSCEVKANLSALHAWEKLYPCSSDDICILLNIITWYDIQRVSSHKFYCITDMFFLWKTWKFILFALLMRLKTSLHKYLS